MSKNIFNINKMLNDVFYALEDLSEKNNLDLIYNMSKTLPRELRGESRQVENILITVLKDIFHTCKDLEIILSIEAPEDFMHEEVVTFKILNLPAKNDLFFETLKKHVLINLENLNGTFSYTSLGTVEIGIPLTIAELGFRRHYRLPSKSLLQKNILLVIKSQNVTMSITRMFKYFPYNIDISFKRYREDKYDLSQYDIVVIEDHLIDDRFLELASNVSAQLKLVVLRINDDDYQLNTASAFLNKPITQESIFELMVSLFHENKSISPSVDRRSRKREYFAEETTVNTSNFEKFLEQKQEQYAEIIDKEIGKNNASKFNVSYDALLQNFLNSFEKSDLYFRELVNSKSYDEIKEFSAELKKGADLIGAQSMYLFVEMLELVFIHNKYDYLAIYPGRYHLELQKLIEKIKKYLHI